jgi:hypothetical protein
VQEELPSLLAEDIPRVTCWKRSEEDPTPITLDSSGMYMQVCVDSLVLLGCLYQFFFFFLLPDSVFVSDNFYLFDD